MVQTLTKIMILLLCTLQKAFMEAIYNLNVYFFFVWFDLKFISGLIYLLIFVGGVKVIGHYTDQMSAAPLNHDGNLRKTALLEITFS